MGQTAHFFIGKGGVGKSTTSALTAIHLAQSRKDTLLVSMDPAHNQRDIFQQAFSEKPKKVMPHLAVKEIDIDHWMRIYLKDTESQLKKAYSYHSAFNIQNYYGLLRFSPGLEEYALLLAFENTIHDAADKAVIVFDMPPTALTLRFFSLPSITLLWLRELLKLRTQIYAKKEIVSKIKFGKKDIEQDKVKVRLTAMIENHTHLRDHLTADGTSINLVLNDDRLSLAEAVRIRQKLIDMDIAIDRILVNKVSNGKCLDAIDAEFPGYRRIRFPLGSKDLYGLDALQAYLGRHADRVKF
jgi:arsenite-transporting ATPase